MNGGPSIWAVTPGERDKHDQKFDTLSPIMGYVSGEQARKFFLQSGLPSSVLAEIWYLADMNKDGKMDRLEFSIAMKLVKLKLQGTPLPSALPIIMKQPPMPVLSLNNPSSSMTNPAYGIGSVSNMSMMTGTNLSMLTPLSLATPGLSPLTPMTGLTPMVPMGTGLSPLIASTNNRPLLPTMGNVTLPNGTMGILHPMPTGPLATGLPLSVSNYSSSLGRSSSPAGMYKASSLLDLGSSSSASSSPSVMSPMVAGPSDWAVPHASRLKYRQQFNGLDKQMTGHLTGQQVRGAMATTMLTQTQLASIWTLADVDKDGKLKAEEFILAMHLVDMAKTGLPLPLILPTELVPPSQRGAVNGSSSSLYAALTDDFDIEPPQKVKSNLSFEDRFKANLDRGNAELEKRRLALQEAERRELERRAQKEREEQEKREREALEAEERRRKENERRLERQRELERQKEEERLREIERKEAAQRELERQRKEEWERRRRGELQIKKQQEQDDIITLKAKKRSLEMELEAVGNKHRQISDRLRDMHNKKKLQRTELDITSQRKESRQQDINSIHKQLEEFQRKLSQLTPEQKRLKEKLKNLTLNNLPVSSMSTMKVCVSEKKGTCMKLRDHLQTLEKETAAKLAEMEHYNKDMQELRESQRKQQVALEKLRSVKEDKRRELSRRKEQEEERKRQEEERRRREEEEAQRRIKMEKERQWQEKLKMDEEERQRKLQEEKEAKQREEEERERQALIRAAKDQAEREFRAKEEAERKRRDEERRKREDEERKKKEEEERQRQVERQRQEEERRMLEEERRKLEEERRKLEEERRKEEKRRKDEEERKRLEAERRDEERRREREEEERRSKRAAEAAVRDAEERKKHDEEERKRREEEDRRKRDEERRRLQQEQQEEESRRREEERKRGEEERSRKKEEEEKWKAEEERKRKEEASRQQKQPSVVGKLDIQEKLSNLLRGLEERKGGQPRATHHRKSAALTSFKALYPFTARNNEELSFNADDIIEVDETTEREEGWLYGSKLGKMGWFPESYVERGTPSNTSNNTVASAATAAAPVPTKVLLQSQLSNVLEAAKAAGTKSAFTPTHSPHLAPLETQGQLVVGNLLAQALCSWTAKTDNHLNFNKDDVIQVLEQQENWWLGELNSERGWFPKTYVTLLGEEESSDLKSSPPDASESSDSLQPEEYLALYTYESPEPGDLTFKEGDMVLVSKRDGEWWSGSIGDRTGVFPSNYVKPKETDTSSISGKKKQEIGQVIKAHPSTGPEQLNLENGQLVLVLGKNATGWWLGELQARGKKRQKGWFPSSHIKILGSNSGKSTPAPQPVCQVIAIYDYAAANGDEMSFSKSQLINVMDKSNPDWWKGEINGVTGLFPTNYVKMTTADCDPSQQWCADLNSLDSMSPQEKKRQGYIHELIQTEERYVEDLNIVLEVFQRPMSESGRVNEAEMSMIFVNWKDLLACNTKLLKALRVRKKTGGDNMPVQMIGDILAAELSHMQPYIRFCSCQINGATLLQTRTDNEPDFKTFLKKIATDYRCKGMPLSSFLLKPMQRITRYPLHIKNILESTAEGHADRDPLRESLERAEELCQQVNEGVREKENSDRLEWIQTHVQCDGAAENLVFNSLTNCLGPRKLLHSGKMFKAKSNKELWSFLFKDFLLLTYAAKQFSSSGPDKLFSSKNNAQLKMYKPPVLLNEVLVKLPDPSSDEPIFHISHIDRVYILRTDNINERTAWVQKIKAASEEFIETEKRKREKAYQARSVKTSGIGRLLVTILEATELKAGKPNGKSHPYCEVTMGAQIFTSRTLNDTLNPKWNFNCQFHIRDIYQDVLCITVFERDQFSPDVFLGRTEVPVATIKKELENKGPVTRRLLLHEVPTGEVWVRLDLQLFSGK